MANIEMQKTDTLVRLTPVISGNEEKDGGHGMDAIMVGSTLTVFALRPSI